MHNVPMYAPSHKILIPKSVLKHDHHILRCIKLTFGFNHEIIIRHTRKFFFLFIPKISL